MRTVWGHGSALASIRAGAVALALCLIGGTQVAQAYTWKWVDGEGQIHLTDNYPSIPDVFKESAVQVDATEPAPRGKTPPPAAPPAAVAPPAGAPAAGAAPVPGAGQAGERLRMTSEGSIEAIPAAPARPAAGAAAGAQEPGQAELPRDGCGYSQRDWVLKIVPLHQDLERAQAQAKLADEKLSKSFGLKPRVQIQLRNDKQWADQKLAEAKKMVERTIPEDARRCATPSEWLVPPKR